MTARVLAVEDSPALRALLQVCLARGGYEVDIAEDGGAAADMFEAARYDAVIMDLQMPVMDGFASVARMRECEKKRGGAAVPILALSANAEPSEARKCLEAGFTKALRKPFGRAELLAALARELGGAPADAAAPIFVQVDPDIADLIPPFLASCRRDAASMRRAAESGDYAAISAASHRLIGTGATYGFQLISDEGRLIEAAARDSDAATILARVDAIELYLKRLTVVHPDSK